jgi:hypothetical protein
MLGDQIGRIFTHWVIVYSMYCFNYRRSPKFWAAVFHDKINVSISSNF